MINPQEIRPGNAIAIEGQYFTVFMVSEQRVEKVRAINNPGLVIDVAPDAKPEGIKLTENLFDEIGCKVICPIGPSAGNRIVRFPFTENGLMGYTLFPFQLLRSLNKTWRLDPGDYSEAMIKRAGMAFVINDIEFLHQIQNLYFDFVREPLPVIEALNQISCKQDITTLIK